MDRRKEDRGRPNYDFTAKKIGGTDSRPVIEITKGNRRSGQDRRKHDLLGEARKWLGPVQVTATCYRDQESARAVNILITVMDRRGK